MGRALDMCTWVAVGSIATATCGLTGAATVLLLFLYLTLT